MGFAVLDNVTLYNETNYTFSFENQDNVSKCHNLTINVTAVSELGESRPGNVSRSFPTGKTIRSAIKILLHCCPGNKNTLPRCIVIIGGIILFLLFNTAPQPFRSEIDIDVIFLRNGTPITEVSFQV